MKHFVLLVVTGLFLAVSCDNYVSNKRDGLKPYDADGETKEAQEESE